MILKQMHTQSIQWKSRSLDGPHFDTPELFDNRRGETNPEART